MSVKRSVWIKEPRKVPRHTNISDSLHNLQKTVGGYIEMVALTTDCAVLCDEDGIRKGYEQNVAFLGHQWYGTIVLIGTCGEEFADCPIKTVSQLKGLLPELWDDVE